MEANSGSFVGQGLGQEEEEAVDLEANETFPEGTGSENVRKGFQYKKGEGVERNEWEAAYQFYKSAEAGHPEGQYQLGILYEKGEGLPKCDEMAEKSWRLSTNGGNMKAARALYNFYMERMEVDLAKKYFEVIFKIGHHGMNRIRNEKFHEIEVMEVERKKKQKLLEEFEKKNDLDPAGLKFIDRLSRFIGLSNPNISKILKEAEQINFELSGQVKQDPRVKKLTREIDLEEIGWKAAQGSESAKDELDYHFESLKFTRLWISNPPPFNMVIAEMLAAAMYKYISTPGGCRGCVTAEPLRTHLCSFFKQMLDMRGHEVSEFDKHIRLGYCFASKSDFTYFHAQVLEVGLKKYPDEPVFYRHLADIYAYYLRKPEIGLEVCERGLAKFPTYANLLYNKARLFRDVSETSNLSAQEEVRKNYHQFLSLAPGDHVKVPDVYFSIGLSFLAESKSKLIDKQKKEEMEERMRYYYMLGKVALSTLFSIYKTLLTVTMKKLESVVNYKGPICNDCSRIGKGCSEPTAMQEKRVECIKKFRKIQKSGTWTHLDQPAFPIMTSEQLVRMQITGRNPLYENIKEIQTFTVIEDPIIGPHTIRLLVEDENGHVHDLLVADVPRNEDCLSKFQFGCRFVSLNPGLKMLNKEVYQQTDFAGVISLYKVTNMCRSCGKENATKTCGNCKVARYCSRECQEDDWKILKHKLMCKRVKENVKPSRNLQDLTSEPLLSTSQPAFTAYTEHGIEDFVTDSVELSYIVEDGAILVYTKPIRKTLTVREFREKANDEVHKPPPFKDDSDAHEYLLEFVKKNKGTFFGTLPMSFMKEGHQGGQVYLGTWGSIRAFQVESLHCCNYLHFGAPKVWILINKESTNDLKNLLAKPSKPLKEGLQYEGCMLELTTLVDNKIIFYVTYQKAGEVILSRPGIYYAWYNMGFNVSESVYFAMPDDSNDTS